VIQNWLVVWNMNFTNSHILWIMVPTDFHIFQRGGSHQPGWLMLVRTTFPRVKPSLYQLSPRRPRTGSRMSGPWLPLSMVILPGKKINGIHGTCRITNIGTKPQETWLFPANFMAGR
jgi:hypothetical protein